MAKALQVPVIGGISSVLSGTTLQYLSDLGLPGIGFEAGRHEYPQSVKNMEAAIKTLLLESGMINESYIDSIKQGRKAMMDFGQSLPSAVKFS